MRKIIIGCLVLSSFSCKNYKIHDFNGKKFIAFSHLVPYYIRFYEDSLYFAKSGTFFFSAGAWKISNDGTRIMLNSFPPANYVPYKNLRDLDTTFISYSSTYFSIINKKKIKLEEDGMIYKLAGHK
jgi:hypothetical protein